MWNVEWVRFQFWATSKERVHTGHIDNLSPLMTNHRSGSELRKKKHCIESRLDGLVSNFRRFLQLTAARHHDAGVTYQDAYAAELALNLLKRGL